MKLHNTELEQQQLRFYHMVNFILATGILSLVCYAVYWLLAKVFG